MADYFTHLSFEFSMPTDEAADKAIALLREIEACIEDETVKPGLEAFEPFVKDGIGPDLAVESEGNAVWVSDDWGCPNLDLLVAWLQEALRRFHPDGAVGFEWATGCSKKRVGAFGGGAAFVTKDEEQWINGYGWLEEQTKRFEKDNKVAVSA
jgi:hypothetical protein